MKEKIAYYKCKHQKADNVYFFGENIWLLKIILESFIKY